MEIRLDDVTEQFLKRQENAKLNFERGYAAIAELLPALSALEPTRMEFDRDGGFMLSVAGTKDKMKKFIGVLVLAGWKMYAPESVEDEKQEYFSTFFNKGDATLFFSFSSSECKRVKIGTEMKEVDIYEVRCES